MGAFFTATSMIGFIAGAGIVVRNSIILVDFIELRLREGMPLAQAVVDAGAVRFRPMALTAAAVIVGSAVILFDPIFQGLAISLMAGEIASLLLSPLTVPVLYYLMNERRRHRRAPGRRAALGSRPGGRRDPESGEPETHVELSSDPHPRPGRFRRGVGARGRGGRGAGRQDGRRCPAAPRRGRSRRRPTSRTSRSSRSSASARRRALTRRRVPRPTSAGSTEPPHTPRRSVQEGSPVAAILRGAPEAPTWW